MTTPACHKSWRRSLYFGIGLLPAIVFAQTPDPTETPDAATEAGSNLELMQIIGFAMGERVGLNMGFSQEELDAIFAGMSRFANNEGRPDNFQELVPQAQRLYFERMRTFRTEQVSKNRAESEAFLAQLDQTEGVMKTESGLRYEIISAGSDEKPEIGKSVVVDYRGTRIDGTQFDSGESATFPLQSRGGLIDGFKEGLQLIGKGGEIKLYIPTDLAYGDNAPPGGQIQPGDALIFEVKLLDIREGPPQPAMPDMPANMRPPGPPPGAPPPGPPPAMPKDMPKPPPPPAGASD